MWWDAALYGASAVLAGLAARFDYIPLQREWGRLAVGPYAAGAVVAALLALRWRRRPARRPLRARAVLAVAVLAGAMLLPFTLEVAWRAYDGDRLHVQSEIFLIEQGSRVLLHGGDPYRAVYGYGLLRSYPPGVWEHVPYLPAVFVFGLPRALLGAGPLTDARIAIMMVSVVVALLALALSGAPGAQRLRLLMVLLVLPTGARYLTGGGDDVVVLALLLLAVVLERRGRPVAAGAVAGVAAAIKQTAWPLLPFLALAARDRVSSGGPAAAVGAACGPSGRGTAPPEPPSGRRATGRFLAAVAAAVVPLVAPFAVWDLHRLVDSVVLYPLGLSSQPTIARGPTIGRLLATPFPEAKGAIAALGALAVVALALWLLVRRTPATVAAACWQAAVVFALAVLLATAGRLGYLIYPINLLVWSWCLRDRSMRREPGGEAQDEAPAAVFASALACSILAVDRRDRASRSITR